MPALEARNLVKFYAAVPAVNGVSFSLSPGEVLGCLGPNGSGKSTTVRMLTGLIEPTRGEIFAGGTNIQRDLVKYRERLGYVPEEPELYPFLSGWEYLELVATLRGLPRAELEKKLTPCSIFFRWRRPGMRPSVLTRKECGRESF